MTLDSSWSPVDLNDILNVDIVEVFDVFEVGGGVDVDDSISSVMGNVITTEIG